MAGGWGHWDASWLWSLPLFAITIAIHAVGVVAIAHGLVVWRRGHPRGDNFPYARIEAIGIIVVVALILGALHAIECCIWAAVYVHLGAFPTVADAALYSVDSMTTRGSSTGTGMEEHWRMMGAIEAGNGMLLFGISTAFLFAVMAGLWKKPVGG